MKNPAKPDLPFDAAALRKLAQERRSEQTEDAQTRKNDGVWSEKRAELEPKAIEPVKNDLVRRVQKAAVAGELSLVVELGVDETRLRASSHNAMLPTTEALLSPRVLADKQWAHSERIGWLLQSKDGKQLSSAGTKVVEALRAVGFTLTFTPFHVKDAPANPYHNASLEITW